MGPADLRREDRCPGSLLLPGSEHRAWGTGKEGGRAGRRAVLLQSRGSSCWLGALSGWLWVGQPGCAERGFGRALQTAAGPSAVPAGHTALRTQHSCGGRQTPGRRTRSLPCSRHRKAAHPH